MYTRIAIIVAVLISAASFAFFPPQQVAPFDFVTFGVAAAMVFRFPSRWEAEIGPLLQSAIYFGCLLAGFGLGVWVTGNHDLKLGAFGLLPIAIALLGTISPEKPRVKMVAMSLVFLLSISFASLAYIGVHLQPYIDKKFQEAADDIGCAMPEF